MIAEFYHQIDRLLNQLALLPNLTVLDITPVDLVAMYRNCLAYGLLPRNALHLASMQKVGCTNLVSMDSDFDHIAGIQRYSLE